MYTATRLIELLEQQHQTRGQSELFKKGIFDIQWRAKVGSFPHPDVETIVSAGEPCGRWNLSQGRPEDKRNVSENFQRLRQLPLNGYIPGSVIRGIVRSWAKQRPDIYPRMLKLLGYQQDDRIQAGKIEFLDAWPEEPAKLTLDIVNPQEEFQVFHQGQCTPLSFYTLGDGEDSISVTVAIRGIPNNATPSEVAEVWEWVKQALTLYGVGSRTASGYGAIKTEGVTPTSDPNYSKKTFQFSLYSQGSYGENPQQPDVRPSHWRGWLRSWVLRFLLGVMSEPDAKRTLAELFGVLEPPPSCKGCVRLRIVQGSTWGNPSENQPRFYAWKGQFILSAPTDILNKILLPIIRFAVMVGGVGRGWRRPLHIFQMNNGHSAARGTYLTLKHKVQDAWKLFGLSPNAETWNNTYKQWREAVQQRWPSRFTQQYQNPVAEVFSPETCAVYIVPEPSAEPVNFQEVEWDDTRPLNTRGEGVELVYQSNAPRNYKRNSELGGNAAGGGNSYCSWVSIKRVNISNPKENTDCQEVVCLFMGGKTPQSNHIRSRFLQDLAGIQGAVYLFGKKPSK